MPRRSDTREATLLTLELLRRIPRSRKITASELHAQLSNAGFNRDLRTVQRILDMLSANFDIERDERTKPYGYRWKSAQRGFSVPSLTEQESLLLALAEQQLKLLLPETLTKSMKDFFEAARSNLDSDGKSRLGKEWLGKVRVISPTQPLLSPKIKTGVFESVSSALYSNSWLEIEYQNASGVTSKSLVMPLGLAQLGQALYLACRYEGYENERTLALHRIISARETSMTFTRPKDFDIQKYDADGRFSFGDGKKIRLTFEIKKDYGLHLLESRLSEDQTSEELVESYKISATVVSSDRLEWWLNSYGENISNIEKISIG